MKIIKKSVLLRYVDRNMIFCGNYITMQVYRILTICTALLWEFHDGK